MKVPRQVLLSPEGGVIDNVLLHCTEVRYCSTALVGSASVFSSIHG